MDTNSNGNTNRQSESPACTIDSHDSTTGSLDTIVDRSLNREELLKQTLAQSVNTTNEQHDSLTNSQISMIQRNNHSSDDEHQRQQLQLQQQQQPQLDAQSHIYSSPVYAVNPEQKPPLKLTAAALLESVTATKGDATAANGAATKPQLISHEEFQKQLQTNAANANATKAASRAATLDSRISKKQRLPPELIKCKDFDQDYASMSKKQGKELKELKKRNRSPFPVQIALGTIQLVLAISLVALGALLLVRETALSTAGCGIWTGLTAAVTGSLGVVSMRKTQSAFLALSLICIATSTLALAISGVGLSRDINHMEEQFDLMNANDQISAASGLIFALFLHFVVSVVSVYRCALQMCARAQAGDLNDVIVKSNSSGITLDQEKIEQYLKAMSLSDSEKENTERLAAMWMYATQMGSMPPTKTSTHKITPPAARPIMLIPASTGGSSILTAPPQPPPPLLLAPPMGVQYRGMTLPYMRPPVGSLIYAAHPMASSLHGTYRTHKSNKSADINSQRRRRRAAAAGLPVAKRSGEVDANRRQRSKSEADVVDGQAFTYTGLDRVIADSFLARQEQSNAGSHIDYTSSSSTSDTYGGGKNSSSGGGNRQAASRASSKTKIVCRDVMM